MSELVVAFEGYIKSDLIIYAFLETQPINEKWVKILDTTPFGLIQIQQQFGPIKIQMS